MCSFFDKWFGSKDPAPETTGMKKYTITVGEYLRDYYLYIPTTGMEPRSLVVSFHGGSGNAKAFVTKADLQAMADENGFILAAPEGARKSQWAPRSWNADSIVPSGWAERTGVDDLGFITALISHARTKTLLKNDVFLVGHSKGGMMAYHAACELPNIKAIGVCATTLSSRTMTSGAGVWLHHIHGTDDQNVPIAGNDKWPPVSRGIDYFTNLNGPGMVNFDLVQGGEHEWFSHATNNISILFKSLDL
jgi:polyhydroxybutyrate depolymerase